MPSRGRPKKHINGVPDTEEERAAREAAALEYFANLPADSFLAEEEVLRSALLGVIAETGTVRLSIAAQREEVRQAKQQLNMPPGAGLTQWLTLRAAADFSLVPAPNGGEKLLCAAGEQDAEAGGDSLEDFYAALPENELTRDELVLREQVLVALKRMGGRAQLAQLARGEASRKFQNARAAALPKGAPLGDWLERRLGSEVSVEAEAPGGRTASLLPAGHSAAASLLEPQKSMAKWATAAPGPLNPNSIPLGQKQYQPDVQQLPDPEQAKLDREVRVQEYLHSLPGDSFTLEEQALREALLVSIDKHAGHAERGVQVRFSVICQEPIVMKAKVGLLPSEVTVAAWIESRMGEEIVLSRDSGQLMCERVAESAPESAEERDAQVVEYFQGHPAMSAIERNLKSKLLDAVARRAGEAIRLSDLLNSETFVQNAWNSAKSTWLMQRPPLEVSFDRWVELRMPEEFRITREPYIQFSRFELERRGLGAKRGAEGLVAACLQSAQSWEQPPAKMARTSVARPGEGIRPRVGRPKKGAAPVWW